MSSLSPIRFNILRVGTVALATSVIFLAGCAMDSTAPAGDPLVPSATVKGTLMGGQQPISGSTIDLYSVGTTGYGSVGTHLATVTTGIGGNFQFNQVTTQSGPSTTLNATYGCPSSSTLIYLTATGGDPTNTGSGSNAAIKMLAALGTCSSIKTGIYFVDEVSTAVSLAALQEYISPINETIGSPTTTLATASKSAAATGIKNAFNQVLSIMNYGTGQVNATYVLTGGGGSLTATPDVAKINTIADILAACINTISSSSGPCVALFSAAVATPSANEASTNFATSYTPLPIAGDTMQAGLFMLQNSTDSGTQATSCNGTTTTTNIGCLFSLVSASAPFAALTAAPTDWTVGVEFGTSGKNSGTIYTLDEPEFFAVDAGGNIWLANYATSNRNLTELSPVGVPLVSTASILTLSSPYSLIVDPFSNVWVANSGGTTVTEYTSGGATNTFTVASAPRSISSDGTGNILVLEPAAGELQEISSTGTVSTIVASGMSVSTYSTMVLDSNYNAWITTGSTGLVEVPYTSGSYATTSTLYTPSVVTEGEPITIDNANNVWVANYTGTLAKVPASSASAGASYAATGATELEGAAVDGAGNIWVSNYTSTASGIYEVSNSGTALSPSTGFAHTAYNPKTIAIDPSGNVWQGGSDSATYTTELVEVLGAAVPVVTPIAAGLPATAGGTNYVGTTPQ